MSEPHLGEIKMFGGHHAPQGWAFCDGQLLSIAEHDALFNLIGTTYGGDGVTTFALPDLRGRLPVHNPDKTAVAGSSLPHEEVQPYPCSSFIIALEGIYCSSQG